MQWKVEVEDETPGYALLQIWTAEDAYTPPGFELAGEIELPRDIAYAISGLVNNALLLGLKP